MNYKERKDTMDVIKTIRPMNKKEMKEEGWSEGTTVLELADGTILYASRDDEGNGPGCLFGRQLDGTHFKM